MMTDSQASSGWPTEATSFTKMPQCSKCTQFDPEYFYTVRNSVEGLCMTCTRCGYEWVMQCASESDLA